MNAVKTTRIGLSNNFNKPKSKIREWLWVVEMEESTGERCIKNKKRFAYHIFVCIALHQTQINSLVFDLATALKSMLTNYPIQIWLCVKPIRVKDCNKNRKKLSLCSLHLPFWLSHLFYSHHNEQRYIAKWVSIPKRYVQLRWWWWQWWCLSVDVHCAYWFICVPLRSLWHNLLYQHHFRSFSSSSRASFMFYRETHRRFISVFMRLRLTHRRDFASACAHIYSISEGIEFL